MKNFIRRISIISYLLIILAGWMSGIPLIIYLIFTVFDFGNIDQLFAIFGCTGIILNLTKWKTNIIVTILSFILMLSPVISRLIQVPIGMFNYLAFQIPLTIFIITYLIYIILNVREKTPGKDLQ
ncbi:hypothetical protein ATE47_03365 [Chryseobacterium sp. IHB B 17019]|jgi:hypothetical protein|uniref:hypothetical protein n=1 Tax=Chryseobacterium sp. IHB B 17019 TaxID=1721091 RepID=UPI0007227F81|nr:hypothetical protein [Chryseobacterium sp. IHB B 17019]ALR29623.1 hypothetical protein ATE47_03365 [Chryseobacterium sp. IHB B 17019]